MRWDRSWRHCAPIVGECAEKFDSRAKVGFVDTEAELSLVQELGIKSVPVVGCFRHGEMIALHYGWHLDLVRMTECLLRDDDTVGAVYVRGRQRTTT